MLKFKDFFYKLNYIRQYKQILHGFFLYYFFPKKKIVLIMCSARSGSTLLKALLAEAPEASNLPEFNFYQYKNKYQLYANAYHLSKNKIILLKQPFFYAYNEEISRWRIPGLKNIRIIILIRDAYGVIKSVKKMPKKPLEEYNNCKFVNQWYLTYSRIIRKINNTNRQVQFVKYEDLLNDPISITKHLFSFIGSNKVEGVDSYKKPINFEWQWGADDGGKKIKSLTVINKMDDYDDKDLLKEICKSEKAEALRKKLGYTKSLHICLN